MCSGYICTGVGLPRALAGHGIVLTWLNAGRMGWNSHTIQKGSQGHQVSSELLGQLLTFPPSQLSTGLQTNTDWLGMIHHAIPGMCSTKKSQSIDISNKVLQKEWGVLTLCLNCMPDYAILSSHFREIEVHLKFYVILRISLSATTESVLAVLQSLSHL